MAISKDRDEIWNQTFDILRDSITSSSTTNDNLSQCAILELKGTLQVKLRALSSAKEAYTLKFARQLQQDEIALQCLQYASLEAVGSCSRHQKVADSRIHQQVRTTERRIRELVYEILGEYAKNNVRVIRRQGHLHNARRADAASVTKNLLWARAMHEFIREATGSSVQKILTYKILGMRDSELQEEIQAIVQKLKRKSLGLGHGKYDIVSVARISRIGKSTGQTSGVSRQCMIASNRGELKNFTTSIRNWIYAAGGAPGPATATAHSITSASSASSSSARVAINSASSSSSRDGKVKSVRLKDCKLGHPLQSNCIAWLQPPSYLPELWNQILTSSQYAKALNSIVPKRGDHKGDISSTSDDAQCQLLLAKYQVQHLSKLASNCVYYCLEERAQAQAQLKTAECDDCVLQCQQALETIYVHSSNNKNRSSALSNTFISEAHDTSCTGNSSPSHRQADIRACLLKPLFVEAMLDEHRNSSKLRKQHGLTDNQTIDNLKSFPDIAQVTSSTGQSFHFAQAVIGNLPETRAFAAAAPTSDQLRAAAQTCPHPLLPLLAQSQTQAQSQTALHTLYCLVVVPVINITCTADNETSCGSFGDCDYPAASNAGKSLQIMMPLPDVCVDELLRKCLWPNAAVGNVAPTSSDVTHHLPQSLVQSHCSFVDLVPDHARWRFHGTSSIMNTSNPGASGGDSGRLVLQHKYLLFGDEYSCILAPSDMSTSELQPNAAATPLMQTRPCYYLVQLRPQQLPGDITCHEYGAAGSGFGTCELGSESSRSLHSDDELFHSLLMSRASCTLTVSSHVSSTAPNGPVVVGELKEDKVLADSSATSSAANMERRWDPNILSTICRWRSCLSESTYCSTCSVESKVSSKFPVQSVTTTTIQPPPTSKKVLCAYHDELRGFVDHKMNKGFFGDSSKYLPPPKAPLASGLAALSEYKRDLITIRAASSLLQELWDGKLRSTVKSYTKKVAQTLGWRAFMEGINIPADIISSLVIPDHSYGGNGSVDINSTILPSTVLLPPAPAWSVWKNSFEEAQEIAHSQDAMHEVLLSIQQAEQSVTAELREMVQYQLFPSVELTIVKKDMKAFKDMYQQRVADFIQSRKMSTINGGKSALPQPVQQPTTTTASAASLDGIINDSSYYNELTSLALMEQKLCEKKLSLMAARVQDAEEAKQIQLRKNSKLKQAEDNQTSDPANFNYRNQRRF